MEKDDKPKGWRKECDNCHAYNPLLPNSSDHNYLCYCDDCPAKNGYIYKENENKP
jgi:hypothetical protein